MQEIYEMVKVDEVPKTSKGKKVSKHVLQLNALLASGNRQIKLKDVMPKDVTKVYNGLKQASSRDMFRGKVNIIKDYNDIYIVRR